MKINEENKNNKFSIDKEFDKFLEMSYKLNPKDMPKVQYKQLRIAYYAGMLMILSKVREFVDFKTDMETLFFFLNLMKQTDNFMKEPLP